MIEKLKLCFIIGIIDDIMNLFIENVGLSDFILEKIF